MTNQCTVTVAMPRDVFKALAGTAPFFSKRRVAKHVSALLSTNDVSAVPDHCCWIGDKFFVTQIVESDRSIDPGNILLNQTIEGVSVMPLCNVAA